MTGILKWVRAKPALNVLRSKTYHIPKEYITRRRRISHRVSDISLRYLAQTNTDLLNNTIHKKAPLDSEVLNYLIRIIRYKDRVLHTTYEELRGQRGCRVRRSIHHKHA